MARPIHWNVRLLEIISGPIMTEIYERVTSLLKEIMYSFGRVSVYLTQCPNSLTPIDWVSSKKAE